MEKIEIPKLYKKFFIDNGIDRSELFKKINNEFKIDKVLYPGSFVHITPSLYFPEVVYVDIDKRCKKFFSANNLAPYIQANKVINKESVIRFYESSYENEIMECADYFDMLISQYAGFVSNYYTKYLKNDGILLANDSHGDATLAYISGNYDLVGIINDKYEIDKLNNELYFKMKRDKEIDISEVMRTGKGPNYSLKANSYIFRKRKKHRTTAST